jgi:hypothetical protein
MALGEPMKGLAGQEFLSDLALELDAVRAVLGHGLPSFESPARRSIPSRPIVRPEGPTPIRGVKIARRNTVQPPRESRLRISRLRSPLARAVTSPAPGIRRKTRGPAFDFLGLPVLIDPILLECELTRSFHAGSSLHSFAGGRYVDGAMLRNERHVPPIAAVARVDLAVRLSSPRTQRP